LVVWKTVSTEEQPRFENLNRNCEDELEHRSGASPDSLGPQPSPVELALRSREGSRRPTDPRCRRRASLRRYSTENSRVPELPERDVAELRLHVG
jgi:hypothetical protein